MAHKPTIAHNQPNIAAVIQQDGQAPHVPMLLVTHLQGQLVDVVDVQFSIFNSAGTVQIDPVAGRHDLDWASRFPTGDKLSIGRFAPNYTPDVAILAAAEYQVRYWFKYKTGGVEHSLNQQLLVVDESAAVDLETQILATSTGLYCTEVQVRDEGFNDSGRWKKTRIDPLHMSSSICAFFISSFSTMQSAPDLFTGQYFMHSRPHFFGWHNSLSNTATRWVMTFFLFCSIYTSLTKILDFL